MSEPKTRFKNEYYITPEALAEACHDCSGNPIKSDTGVSSGVNSRCQPIDINSKLCIAKKIEYIDASKNQYYIALADVHRLYDPTEPTNRGRYDWIACNRDIYDIYISVCKTGIKLSLRTIRDKLGIS